MSGASYRPAPLLVAVLRFVAEFMTPASGTRLGLYEIVSALGVGGMGEVYRAHDMRLERDVAIKILPEIFAADPERLARFEREAKVLASLNHPNIAAIHSLEETNGVHALVLELVEGDTLADRIERGAIPIDEVLPIAKQVADALEAAHEQGIIHRDLKPANIKLREDGRVKVLDFGLAKLTEARGAGLQASGPAVSISPTITSPAMMTGAGVILGTAAYMSPEQAKGRPADKRSDMWAYGCVLYEMLTGRRAFDGEDVSDTLAAVLRGEPDWSALPSSVPPPIRTLVQRCLVKDRRQRIADISVAQFLLTEPASLEGVIGASPTGVTTIAPPWKRIIPSVAAATLVGAAIASAIWWYVEPSPPSLAATRFSFTLPEGQAFTNQGRTCRCGR